MENQTGEALARAVVALQPIPGTPGVPRTARTNSTGSFEFNDVRAGAYVVKATQAWIHAGRIRTEAMEFGRNSADPDAGLSQFLSIRLPRYGAITGAVLDENDIGMPQQEVVAYRKRSPARMAGRATTDDRGVYRVRRTQTRPVRLRSAGRTEEDIAISVPRFSRQTLRVNKPDPVDVHVDADARDVDVRPMSGRLFTLRGDAEPIPPSAGPLTITLSSDMGRQRAVGAGVCVQVSSAWPV